MWIEVRGVAREGAGNISLDAEPRAQERNRYTQRSVPAVHSAASGMLQARHRLVEQIRVAAIQLEVGPFAVETGSGLAGRCLGESSRGGDGQEQKQSGKGKPTTHRYT